jgi:hypothetical protein
MRLVASPKAVRDIGASRINSIVSEKKPISKPLSSACAIQPAMSLTLIVGS